VTNYSVFFSVHCICTSINNFKLWIYLAYVSAVFSFDVTNILILNDALDISLVLAGILLLDVFTQNLHLLLVYEPVHKNTEKAASFNIIQKFGFIHREIEPTKRGTVPIPLGVCHWIFWRYHIDIITRQCILTRASLVYDHLVRESPAELQARIERKFWSRDQPHLAPSRYPHRSDKL